MADFSSASTKVPRMVNNLAVDNDAKQTMEALRTELQKINIKEKLPAVEELNSQSERITRQDVMDILAERDRVTLERIHSLKQSLSRLERYFQQQYPHPSPSPDHDKS